MIWMMADPRYMNTQDIEDEHTEIHERPLDHGLIFRHEILRVWMNNLPGSRGSHTRSRHSTPVPYSRLDEKARRYIVEFAQSCKRERDTYREQMIKFQMRHERRVGNLSFENYNGTPWDHANVSMEEYVALGEAWDWDRHTKGRPKPWKSGRRT